jgi:hypothetical protein
LKIASASRDEDTESAVHGVGSHFEFRNRIPGIRVATGAPCLDGSALGRQDSLFM